MHLRHIDGLSKADTAAIVTQSRVPALVVMGTRDLDFDNHTLEAAIERNLRAPMLADIIVVIHLLIVVFIIGGVPVVYLGVALRWAWVRRWTWRVVHLGAILFVAAESLLGIACPLTVWEDALRGGYQRAGFIERWVHRVMFYQAPTWVFTTAYIAFAALVLATWIAIPPIRLRHRSV